jgi:hypothetical protein
MQFTVKFMSVDDNDRISMVINRFIGQQKKGTRRVIRVYGREL